MKWRLKYKIHSSWRLALACALFVGGVFLALWINFSAVYFAIFLPCTIGLLFIQQAYGLPLIACSALMVGGAYGSVHLQAREAYRGYFQKQVTVLGRVKEDISRTSSGSFSIQLDTVSIEGVPLPGSVLLSARSSGGALRGDMLEVNGKIKQGLGSFSASVTVTNIISIKRQSFGDGGRVVRDWFADKIRSVIPEPQASLGIGFLTGQKSALPVAVSDALKTAGLTHIVVASGYNLTLLVRLARKLFLRVSKYISVLSSSIMIVLFMAVTGLSPSMTRAGLVSGMSLLSWYYGHAFHPLVLLPVAAAITVSLQPSYVWGDMGWQLSFSAFMGVMVLAPLLHAYFFGSSKPSLVRQLLGETIAAHLVTIPIIAPSFGVISNVAIIANLLVVPFVPFAMLLTFVCGIGAVIHAPLLAIVSYPASWLLDYMIHVATYLSEIPWAQSELKIAPQLWLVYASALIAVCFWMWKKSAYNFRNGQVNGVV